MTSACAGGGHVSTPRKDILELGKSCVGEVCLSLEAIYGGITSLCAASSILYVLMDRAD